MTFVITFFPIGENVSTKVERRYSIYCNISDKCHDKGTEIHNCKKHKLFRMSRQSRTPSEVAHVIQTLSASNQRQLKRLRIIKLKQSIISFDFHLSHTFPDPMT